MTNQDPSVVDSICKSHDGSVTLTIIEHRDWSDQAEILKELQLKLSNYVTFILNGGLRAQKEFESASIFKIDLMCQFEPPATIQKFFEQALEFTLRHKIDFTVTYFRDRLSGSRRIF